MAWIVIDKAKIVKDDVTGEVGILTENGVGTGGVKTVSAASAAEIEKSVNDYLDTHPVTGVTEDQVNDIMQEFYDANKDSLKGEPGEPGEPGIPGQSGAPGEKGADGAPGVDGKSAYQIWLEAGNTGTEQDFLDSLKGEKGADGTMTFDDLTEEQKESLKGAPGPDGKSAYQIWLGAGNSGTEQDFLDSLVGEPGENGPMGESGSDGSSAYEIWINEGNSGTEQDFLDSLKGEKGADGTMSFEDLTEEQKESLKGADGKSAYDIWLDAGNSGSEEDFLQSLVGEPGENGPMGESGSDGASAYETWINEGNSGSEQDFLDSLKGENGQDGFSPVVTITDTDNGHKVSIQDAQELHEFEVTDGKDAEIDDTVKSAEKTWSSEKIASELGSKVYTHPNDLGLDRSVATVDDVRAKLQPGEIFIANTEHFSKCKEIFPYEETSDTAARIIIIRAWAPNRDMVRWEKRDGTKMATGVVGTDGSTAYMLGWKFFAMKDDLSGYVKTYTTLDELGLTADATVDDVYDALKDGETAILATSEFTNQLTMFPSFCTNDQYAILQVEKKNGNRAFIEWRQKDGNAYAIGGLDYNNKFTNWDNLVRFKKDGFGDDSIITIGDAVSSDGTIQTLESLGFSNDILTWKTGIYKVSHVAGLVNLPKDINPDNSPAFRLEHHNLKKWQGNHNPSNNTWGIRTSVFYADNGNIYTIHYQSGDTAGEYIINDDWKTIHTEKEDDNYIPNMYDRNANGDMPVVPFDRLANNMFLIQNQALIKEGEVYDEDYVGGWVYTSANDVLTKEMFNKIKCIVAIPGVLRIGIMNEHLWDANPRYSTCLVKWLVSDFVAYTGLKEYDIEDTILEEGQYLFIECRAGESSWYYNSSTEDVKIGDVTYPASSCTSGLSVADKLDSTTNNVVFKSQSITSTSARTYFGNGQYNVGNKYRTNFLDRHCTSTARTAPKSQDQSLYQGGLNIGLYRRTKYSNTIFCKCVENSMNLSWLGDDNVTKIYAAIGQEEIVGKSVYAFKLDVNTPGNLTIYHLKGNTLDTIEVIDKYTHYVRAKGLQTIHLPFDIKLKEGEYIGFGGLHFKSTSDNIVRHGCKWHYMAGDQTTGSCGWMNTIGKTGFYSIGVSMTSYPETFTSFETNGSYLNIELICRGEKRSPLEDKYISFTGDSITTFANFVTTQAGYPEGNSAGDNAYYYPASGRTVNNIDATWWGILARDNRMQILRNDAWSGSRVSSATGSTDTKCLCGTERRYYLRNTYELATKTTYPFGIPEIVVNMIGTNDLSGNVELGAEMFKGVMGTEEEYKTILSAYSLMCRRFAGEYNKNGAKIVHFIIPRGSDWGYANSNGVTIADLSLAFERIAKAWGQYFIPLSYFTGFNPAQYKKNTCPTASVHRSFRGTEFTSADGLHPNVVGMEILADGVDRFLKEIV